MKKIGFGFVFLIILTLLGCCACSQKEVDPPASKKGKPPATSRSIVLATTTSTHDSGLLDRLMPVFEKQTGITVKTVAVGTGQALELGRRGEADVLLVHAPEAEKAFVVGGHGRNRSAVMHNDFIVVGPEADPAGIGGKSDSNVALKALSQAGTQWISRGDRSGTHQKEQALWKAAGVKPGGPWLIETGQGMGATLRIASERKAYTLTDRGTFLSINNLELEVLVEGDAKLFNPYHVIEVAHGRKDAEAAGRLLAEFFIAPKTQEMIGGFTSRGHKLFTPDAVD
ncbi:MAG: tungsten ABC transporter substrate-binding protein [Proteobacteria bacterium]|nr:tungsten ABC transporter substrate-binding protein [Pseudomonadota bacterium]